MEVTFAPEGEEIPRQDIKFSTINVAVDLDDYIVDFRKKDCGIIHVGSYESPDIEVFYKGKKVTNVIEVVLGTSQMMFENGSAKPLRIITNWKKYLETH